jgi:hypothetical protein
MNEIFYEIKEELTKDDLVDFDMMVYRAICFLYKNGQDKFILEKLLLVINMLEHDICLTYGYISKVEESIKKLMRTKDGWSIGKFTLDDGRVIDSYSSTSRMIDGGIITMSIPVSLSGDVEYDIKLYEIYGKPHSLITTNEMKEEAIRFINVVDAEKEQPLPKNAVFDLGLDLVQKERL